MLKNLYTLYRKIENVIYILFMLTYWVSDWIFDIGYGLNSKSSHDMLYDAPGTEQSGFRTRIKEVIGWIKLKRLRVADIFCEKT